MRTPTFNYKGLEAILRHRLIVAYNQIISNMRAAGKVASGRTIRDMKLFTDRTETGVSGVITAPMWSFITTETGRRQGKIPSNFQSILYRWSIDKGIKFNKDWKRKSFAWCLARKIAKMGTLQHRNGKRTDIYTDVVVGAVKDIKANVTINDLFDINSVYKSSEVFSIKSKL